MRFLFAVSNCEDLIVIIFKGKGRVIIIYLVSFVEAATLRSIVLRCANADRENIHFSCSADHVQDW